MSVQLTIVQNGEWAKIKIAVPTSKKKKKKSTILAN